LQTLPVVQKSRYLKQRFSTEILGLLRDGNGAKKPAIPSDAGDL